MDGHPAQVLLTLYKQKKLRVDNQECERSQSNILDYFINFQI